MCILFIYTNPSPRNGKYQMIIATNRDENYHRPAENAHKWPEDELIIGGKDLEPGREGGTWFGVSLRQIKDITFRAAALLNVTGEKKPPNAQGRGSVVTDYLLGDLLAKDYIERLKEKQYAAFSFVAIELSENLPRVTHYTNVTSQTLISIPLEPHVCGFDNSLPHEPLLKLINGTSRFLKTIKEDIHDLDLTNSLLEVLRWKKQHLPDPVLEKRAPDTFEVLSRVFVEVPEIGYGTRTHTIVKIHWDGTVEFTESTLVGQEWLRTDFEAKI